MELLSVLKTPSSTYLEPSQKSTMEHFREK